MMSLALYILWKYNSLVFFILILDDDNHVRWRFNSLVIRFAFGQSSREMFVQGAKGFVRLFAIWAFYLHLSSPQFIKRLFIHREGWLPGPWLDYPLWFAIGISLMHSYMFFEAFSRFLGFTTKGASERLMMFLHVKFQHGSRHKFLLTDSAFSKLLNTIDVFILPMAINPMFVSPSLG